MRTNLEKIAAAALLVLPACSTTARYVTTEHWSSPNTFYVGYTEYTETNLVITKTGSSTAHVMLCNASEDNRAECRPQIEVDRLLNPDKKYPDPPAPAAPKDTAPAPEVADAEPLPSA